MEELIKEMGFDSAEELHTLVSEADLSTPDKRKAFEDWKKNDGTKDGLLKLDEEK